MKIYLIDANKEIVEEWKKYFFHEENVEYVNMWFHEFMKNYDVECVVSPANSFGLMDGGYDKAITDWFGDTLQKRVQEYIVENYYGEQPVGTSFIIDIPGSDKKLIHTTSMRIPEKIRDSSVVYTCMRTCLMTAKKNGVQSILIPAFGGCTGRVEKGELAKMMFMAYEQIERGKREMTWKEAEDTHYR